MVPGVALGLPNTGAVAVMVAVRGALWADAVWGTRNTTRVCDFHRHPSACESTVSQGSPRAWARQDASHRPRSKQPGPPVTAVTPETRKAAHKSSVFVCYRREDTQDAAGRLHDRLVTAYGRERVFMDIDSVPLGIDFVEHVTEQIGKCNAVIVMIGKHWHTIKDKERRRRLDNDDDLVRAEIRAALQQTIPVIPVTVQNAAMPQAEDLPDDIRLLARRNGIDLSATRWMTDVERLIKELDRVMKPSGGS